MKPRNIIAKESAKRIIEKVIEQLPQRVKRDVKKNVAFIPFERNKKEKGICVSFQLPIKGIVFYEASLSEEWLKWTIAHEIAHYVDYRKWHEREKNPRVICLLQETRADRTALRWGFKMPRSRQKDWLSTFDEKTKQKLIEQGKITKDGKIIERKP